MAFARFMSGPLGRGLRIVAGTALIVLGIVLALAGDTGSLIGGIALVVVGGVFFYAGAANVCFIAPLIRAPFHGRDARA
ncbi:YgaP-like transmembrane domain [Microcella sp.]|jgi:hypothetical protein|uniref:YgaP-like transmembrane domain n=1 Tax=Microcella sp. TaxID=1913979 RepID=UPI002561C131|nr:YgaP-like transmembrane domain [Microcella sp.]MBX9471267.1 DUF2892 domain-containing protein [Microcella sp.]